MDKLLILGECFNSVKLIDNEIENYKLEIKNITSGSIYFKNMIDKRGQLSFRDQRLLTKLILTQSEICDKLIDSLNNKKVFEVTMKELTIELLT